MSECSLVSVIILSYKNFKYLFEAIDSVLIQDYPNIELIISNDGSDDFNESGLISYLNTNRGENISHTVINNNDRNLGTVKNFNHAIRISKGEYLVFLAADDAFYDSSVIVNYINHLESLGSEAYIANSQVEMFDNQLITSQGLACSEEDIGLLRLLNPQDLYRQICVRGFFFPSTCCVRHELFDIIGLVNEEYKLIEDGPLYLTILRNNIKVHYLDKITLKHRHGGLVHGNENNASNSIKDYHKDELKIIKNEMLPYKNILGQKLFHEITKKYQLLSMNYEAKYEFPKYSIYKKLTFLIKNPLIWLNLTEKVIRRIIMLSDDLMKMASWNIFIVGIVLIIVSNFTDISIVTSASIGLLYKKTMMYIGLLCLLIDVYFVFLVIIRNVYKVIKYIFFNIIKLLNYYRENLDD